MNEQTINYIVEVLGFALLLWMINYIRPYLWKRYQKAEFRATSATKRVTKPFYFNILPIIGVAVFIACLIGSVYMMIGIISLRAHFLDVSSLRLHEAVSFVVLGIISVFFGIITPIFAMNSFLHRFFPEYIHYDLLRNMRNARGVAGNETIESVEQELSKQYDIAKIQNHDKPILKKVWLITTAILVAWSLLTVFVI